MPRIIKLLLLLLSTIACQSAIAHGGIGSAGGVGAAFLFSGLGWLFGSIYFGVLITKLTGCKRYAIASPFIPCLFVLLMLLVAGFIGVLVDSTFRVNSSMAESIGLYLSLAIHVLICLLIIWRVNHKTIRRITLQAGLPMVLASYIWVEAFVI